MVDDKAAEETSAWVLSIVILQTLIRKKIVSYEEIIQTIDLYQVGPGLRSAVLDDLKRIVGNL